MPMCCALPEGTAAKKHSSSGSPCHSRGVWAEDVLNLPQGAVRDFFPAEAPRDEQQ